MTNELYHHGVKGMKWGVRKDNRNPNYSESQRRRDRRIYSESGVRRINKSMNRGESISGARSIEAERINSTRRKARVAGQVGSVAGGVGGAVGGYFASKFVTNFLAQNSSPALADAMRDPMVNLAVSAAISTGAAKVGTQLGRYGSQNAAMVMGGYDYRKFR